MFSAACAAGPARRGESGMDVSVLPTLNATLNGISSCFLVGGYLSIRRKRVNAHKAFMGCATATSGLFLISYLIYHYHAGSRPFEGQGWLRPVYFAVLIPHILLSAALVPFAAKTLWHAARSETGRHRRIARWTFPVWMIVSVTGVLVYWMLYQL